MANVVNTPKSSVELADGAATQAVGQSADSQVSTVASAICALTLLVLYIPVFQSAAAVWISNDNYSHGFLVFPCCLAILWLQRDQIKAAAPAPTLWGLVPLIMGLSMEVGSYILQVRYVGMWSLVPTLAGAILLLHGPRMWKVCSFSVFFTLFAAPISMTWLSHITSSLQELSTIGSTSLMTLLGYTLTRYGNVIELPGCTLEIADACSGFHSIVSMLAFTAIYAYLFGTTPAKRILLWAVTVPIALAANVLRISVLIAAANAGGMTAYHAFHDPAAFAEIIVDFSVLVLLGRSLGCDNLRFAPQPAA